MFFELIASRRNTFERVNGGLSIVRQMIGRQRFPIDDISVKHPCRVFHTRQRAVVIIQGTVELLRLLKLVAQEKQGVGQTRRWIVGFLLVFQHILVKINRRFDEELVGINVGQSGINQGNETRFVSHHLLLDKMLLHNCQGLIILLTGQHREGIVGEYGAIVDANGIHIMGAGGKKSHSLVVGVNRGNAVEISQSSTLFITIGHLAAHFETGLRKHQTRVFKSR